MHYLHMRIMYDSYMSVSAPCQHGSSSRSPSPHVALLPGDDMKHSGDQEEGTQAHAVHPGSDPLPAVVRQTMQQRHAHEGRHNEELQRRSEITEPLKQPIFYDYASYVKKK